MCGIAGFVCGGRSGESDLARMLGVLRHRGPDDEGMHLDGDAALGHRRLSIIDLEGGRQPIANEEESAWIVCNGEIYNHEVLRSQLERRGHRFATRSDSEVILHLYEEEGEACVSRLRGMFAFAIWDSRRRELYCARDRFGQKPFYFAHRGGDFVFASEIKALLAYDPGLAEPDPEALDQYLALRIIASPRSMYRDIRKLAPAHQLRFRSGQRLEIRRYWQLDYEPKWSTSAEELLDELEHRLIDCIRAHTVSDVPVGAFVSGGLDSTLVASMLMKHVAADPVSTFSVGLPYRSYDEAPFARMVAERYGADHHERTLAPSLVNTLPELVWHLDEPSDPLAVCMYMIAAMAREHVKVVLGGDGGDELFAGYDRYYGFRYAGYYSIVPAAIRRWLLDPALRLLPTRGWYKSPGHQARWLQRAARLDGGARYACGLGYFYFNREERARLYGPQMRGVAMEADPEAPVREEFANAHASTDVDRMLWADSQVRLPDHPVMILDRMTMAHGLEARSPFLDHELAEFAARLPVNQKIRGRTRRHIQKQLARRYLPQPVLARRKQGFSSALPYMLREEYHLLFRLFLRDSRLVGAGYYDGIRITQLLDEHTSGRVDHGNRLWLLVNSEIWFRTFLEGVGREELHGMLEEASCGGLDTSIRGDHVQT